MHTYKNNWIVGMRTLHQDLHQIRNPLQVVVEFFWLVWLWLFSLLQCHRQHPCQWLVDPKWLLSLWVVPHWVPHHLEVLRAIVVCCLVIFLMRRHDKVEMVTIVEMVVMVELLGPELYRYNRREYQPSIWESSPKTLRYCIDGPMKVSQHGWPRSQTSFIWQKPPDASK